MLVGTIIDCLFLECGTHMEKNFVLQNGSSLE